MALRPEHELHGRRKSLNIGVGLMLGAFVILVMALTYTKITSTDFRIPASQANGVGEQIGEGGND
ncbi:cytochrome C oxidase assembly protein [Sulfitobacter sp. S223]|uniref:cytochrome C oxidase assembly protein n=1 Tax=Sulfitobacter sp. S223 TaxID=2867023 RepID=UPI0021A6D363|nr:cytochrome C oxidase assembly protein [Sulfitobacter sp. S223]UWR27305.1 cytochrome C oxidase assembly protein [Sulfitobacter sp. S223]